MPIYNPEERLRLRDLGYNPDELDAIEEVQELPVAQQNPSPLPKEQQTTALGAAGRSFGRGLPSALTGVGGAVAGGKLGAAIGLPFGGPIGSAVGAGIGSVGGGLIGAFGGRALQDKVVLPSVLSDQNMAAYQASEQQDRAEHSVASTVGEIASSLPFLAPSLKALLGAGRAIFNPIRGVTPAASDIGNLAEVGLGSALPVGGRLAFDPEVTAPELIAEALGGALMNKPWGLGQKLGLSPQVIRELPLTQKSAMNNQQSGNAIPPAREFPQLTDGGPILAGNSSLTPRLLNDAPPRPDALDPVTINESTPETARVESEYSQAQAELQAERSRIETETAKAKAEVARLRAIQSELEPPTISSQESRPKPIITTETGREIYPDYTGNLEEDTRQNLVEPLTEGEVIQDQYDRGIRNQEAPPTAPAKSAELGTERTEPIAAGLVKNSIPLRPTVETLDAYKKLGAERNVNVNADKKLFTQGVDADGKPTYREVAGQSDTRVGTEPAENRINPNKGTIETLPHELTHNFDDDLEVLGSKRSQAFIKRADRVFKDSPEYQTWAAARKAEGLDSSIKEFRATLTGEDAVRRLYKTDNKGDIKNWFDDVRAAFKIRAGKGNTKDVARVMSAKVLYDAPFKETFGGNTKPSVAGVKANAEPTPETKTAEEGTIRNDEAVETTTNITTKSAPRTRQKVALLIPSEIDSIRKIGSGGVTKAVGSEKAGQVADAYTEFYDGFTSLRGKLNNKFSNNVRKLVDLVGIAKPLVKSPRNYFQQDTPELQSTMQKMFDVWDDKPNITFTPAEQKIRAEVQGILKDVRDMHRARPSIKHQPGDDNPDYIPHITKFSVLRKILDNRDSVDAKKLQEDFVKYQTDRMLSKLKEVKPDSRAKAETKARENLDTLLEGYHKKTVATASQYGPIDRAEGFGLPPSWRETNMLSAMDRYLDRVARRFAYNDAIESKGPELQNAIKALRGNKHVQTVDDDIQGVRGVDESKRNAMMGIVSTTNMGPLTGGRDFTANFTLGFQHHGNPIQAVQSAISALIHMKENLADAFETGRIRTHMSELDFGDMVGGLRRVRDVITDAQGRNFLEQITRATSMGQGKFTTLDFHEDYRNGALGKMGQKWFDDFAKGVDWKKKTALTRDELLTIAARYVDSVQGGYDYRGLPKLAVEGSWSPLLKLARWNIEKANNYQKHVFQPLIDGNPTPFLMSTLGLFLGGTAITELTELATGRKDKLPKWKEIQATGDAGNDMIKPALYKTLGLASAAGYAGIVGDTVKGLADRIYGKNKPRWYNNMLLEFGTNAGTTIINGMGAWAEDGLSPDLLMTVTSDFIEDNLQSYRLILARMSEDVAPMGNKESVEKSNKMRDLRVYKTISGEDVSDYMASEYNEDYTRSDLKRFKNEGDLNDAAVMLPDLLKKAIDNAGNNPEKLKAELSKIKRNSYQTMPNPNTIPRSFFRYLNHLEKTQGAEAKQQRLEDYIKQNAVNKAKSAMVP